jgi:tRNA (mo5U34)-methyltransferase
MTATPPEIPDVFWYQSLELTDGRIITGVKSLAMMRGEFENTFAPLGPLHGKTVLDLGTWSGAFAVEAARRGAPRVTAVDYFTWRNEFFKGRAGFDFFVKQSGHDIKALEFDLDSSPLSLAELGEHDVVLLLGVFYHLKDPIAALREIYKLTRETLVLETYIEDRLPSNRPAMMFYPGDELDNDASNWWGPNILCVRNLLSMAGFSQIEDSPGYERKRRVFHAHR